MQKSWRLSVKVGMYLVSGLLCAAFLPTCVATLRPIVDPDATASEPECPDGKVGAYVLDGTHIGTGGDCFYAFWVDNKLAAMMENPVRVEYNPTNDGLTVFSATYRDRDFRAQIHFIQREFYARADRVPALIDTAYLNGRFYQSGLKSLQQVNPPRRFSLERPTNNSQDQAVVSNLVAGRDKLYFLTTDDKTGALMLYSLTPETFDANKAISPVTLLGTVDAMVPTCRVRSLWYGPRIAISPNGRFLTAFHNTSLFLCDLGTGIVVRTWRMEGVPFVAGVENNGRIRYHLYPYKRTEPTTDDIPAWADELLYGNYVGSNVSTTDPVEP